MRSVILCVFVALGSLVLVCGTVDGRPTPVGTAITYQGQLKQGGAIVSGTADLQFSLWDAPSGPSPVSGTVQVDNCSIVDSYFTASVDFGFAPLGLNDGARWLEIAVRIPAGSGPFTTLSPRQPLTPVPFALETRGLSVGPTGNVGIGTGASGSAHLRIYQPTSILHTALQLDGPGFGGSGADISFGGNVTNIKCDDYGKLTINTGRLALMNGLGAVNVGIGTASPGKTLTVAGDMEVGTSAGDYRHLRLGGGNSSGFLYGSYPYYGDGVHIGYNFYADTFGIPHVINFGGATSRISMSYGSVALATGGVNAPPVDRLFVNSIGQVGVGTSAPAFRLDLPNTADVMGRGRANAWTTYSSIRWKENIQPIDSALDKAMRLRGVMFDWKPENGGGHDIGFIAEEVGAVVPELVTWEPDGRYARSMQYDRVTALLVEALRDLRAGTTTELDGLRAENIALRASLLQVTARLDAIEASLALGDRP